MGGCVLKSAWQEHSQKADFMSLGRHACSVGFPVCLAGAVQKGTLDRGILGVRGGAWWVGAFSNLLGRSTPRSCVHVPWADMLAAHLFFSAWQSQCKRALFTEPHWVLRRSLVGGCVLKPAWQERSQKADFMSLGRPACSVGFPVCLCLAGAVQKGILDRGILGVRGGAWWAGAF